MSAELLGCAPKSIASLTLVSPLILVEPIDVGRMLTRYFLKFILLSNEISSGFLRDISAAELIAADPDNRLLSVLKWHLSYSIGNVKSIAYLVTVMTINEQFSKALDLVGNGHFVFGTENKYLLALRDVLKEAVNDQYDYIDWWLYEATDDYTVWEADCTMKYCLKEPEALYDYITGTLKPVPVSLGESTSQQE